MIQSMTGYGKANCDIDGRKVIIEVKCLNSKQLDLYTRFVPELRECEIELRNLIAAKLQRGKIEVQISYDQSAQALPASINKDLVVAYIDQLKDIANNLGTIQVADLLSIAMRLPDVTRTDRTMLATEEVENIRIGLGLALVAAEDFRIREGQTIDHLLRESIEKIRDSLKLTLTLEPARMIRIRERIREGLAQMAGMADADPNRFEQELIYYIEKIDFSEEKNRLANHLDFFLQTMNETTQPPGKKLGFISQEIGREINTLGSKAYDADIQKLVVGMKDELEKIKEQLANVL